MHLYLSVTTAQSGKAIAVSGSKSETNRLLLLQALFPQITIGNLSASDDSDVMNKAIASSADTIDVHHAGTAMRFLTAYFAIQHGREVVLTGSPRMKQRPIGILVDALRELGAQIEYIENDGFPPLKITGRQLSGSNVALDAGVSSQYISALLLIAPKLENGLQLTLRGEITSIPYINMTLALLNQIGVASNFTGRTIMVRHLPNTTATALTVESDWSSASYFYSVVALSGPGTQVTLSSYKPDSLQGDSALAGIYEHFGVQTAFTGSNEIILTRIQEPGIKSQDSCILDLKNTPDIAQTIAVTCLGLGLGCHLTGLHTLKIKETDRLLALQTELTKLGADVSITVDSLTLKPCLPILPDTEIETYNDHRMAMAFAPLALKVPVTIKDAEVVSKSYPAFWDDLKTIGFRIENIR